MFDKYLTYRHNDGKGSIQREVGCSDCKDDSGGLVNYDITKTKDTKDIMIKKRIR